MLSSEDVDLEQRDTNSSFVLFRYPQSAEFYVGFPQGAHKTFLSLAEMKGERGFLIAPFTPTRENPFILLDTSVLSAVSLPSQWAETLSRNATVDNGDSSYRQAFGAIQRELSEHSYKKIVLARIEEVEVGEYSLSNLYHLFLKACLLYPHSYIASWYTPLTGFWITATPELLLSRQNSDCHTMALAGTALARDKKYSDVNNWSEKNRKEHQCVTDFIEEQLKPYAVCLQKSKTYPAEYGNLVHLRTDFKFQLAPSYSALDVINQLHPTPAICGYPTGEIRNILLQHEQINRKYYAGFSGLLGNENARFYVTLRCMNITNNHATLYAGGGVLAESKEKEEWEETERKLNTMRELFEK